MEDLFFSLEGYDEQEKRINDSNIWNTILIKNEQLDSDRKLNTFDELEDKDMMLLYIFAYVANIAYIKHNIVDRVKYIEREKAIRQYYFDRLSFYNDKMMIQYKWDVNNLIWWDNPKHPSIVTETELNHYILNSTTHQIIYNIAIHLNEINCDLRNILNLSFKMHSNVYGWYRRYKY